MQTVKYLKSLKDKTFQLSICFKLQFASCFNLFQASTCFSLQLASFRLQLASGLTCFSLQLASFRLQLATWLNLL